MVRLHLRMQPVNREQRTYRITINSKEDQPMITEQYVSFDTAKLLKEAGFNVPCRGVYVTDRTGYCEFREYENRQTTDDLCWNTEDGFQYEYLAPTQALAVRWLREVHNIHLFVNYFFEDNMWFYVTVDLTESDEVKGIHPNESNYESYEEALEAGLQEALKLIKK